MDTEMEIDRMKRNWMTGLLMLGCVGLLAGCGGTDSYLGVHRVQEDVLDYHPVLARYKLQLRYLRGVGGRSIQ